LSGQATPAFLIAHDGWRQGAGGIRGIESRYDPNDNSVQCGGSMFFKTPVAQFMAALKGILYATGNIEFPCEHNAWAFQRMQSMRSDQEKRIIVHPQVAPVELTRAAGVEEEKTPWLESFQDMLNACSSLNLLRRTDSLRLRKGIFEVDDQCRIVTLVSQEAFDEFAHEHWRRIAYFYAYRHDIFRFDITTLISMKNHDPARPNTIELTTRVSEGVDGKLPGMTFDATGTTAHVDIVEWRGSVQEGESGRFKIDDTQVRLAMPKLRIPITFLYERRPEFDNHAYYFSGERLESALKRMMKRHSRPKPPESGD
jgi:hypothetical protein